MARKKRKAGKRSADIAPPQFSGGRDLLLPGLGALTLVLAWLAFLGGVSDGTTDVRHTFGSEMFRPQQIFRDLFLVDGFPASGWAQSPATFYFPDYAVQWPLFALGTDPRVVFYLFALAQVALGAAGWIYVADFVFGKSAARRAVILLLHALPLLALAYGRNDMFNIITMSVFHYGTWAVVPWLAGLLLRAMESPSPPAGKIGALTVLLAATAGSDKIIIVWFVAPATFAILWLLFLRQTSGSRAGILIGAMTAGIVLGAMLDGVAVFRADYHVLDHYRFNSPAKILDNLASLGAIFADRFVGRNTVEFLVWLPFAAIALWRLAFAMLPRRGRGGALFKMFSDPAERTGWRLFTAIFIPASAACCVAAPALNSAIYLESPNSAIVSLRYMLPAAYFPLFVGWGLLPSVLPARAARRTAAAAMILIAAAAAPKIFAIDSAALDPFNTPFHRCFAENAKRLGWTGGIAGNGAPILEANPNAGVAQAMPIYFHDGGPGRSALATHWYVSNWHRFIGEFQFVMLNEHKGRAFYSLIPPRDEGDLCATDDHECIWGPSAQGSINEERVRGAFGEPAEVVECEGVAFFHYDPPMRFDFSGVDIPHARVVGKFF